MADKIRLSSDDFKTFREFAEYVTIPPTIPPTTPPPSTGGRSITVTPANYKSILKNIADDDFTGSTAEFVQVKADQVRLETPCDYLNFEMEAEIKVVSAGDTGSYIIQPYGRGGHHGNVVTVPMPENTGLCMGCAYKGRFKATEAFADKEVNHPAYCQNRNDSPVKYQNIIGRWCKYKLVVKNLPAEGAITPVSVEAFLDGSSVAKTIDKGGWSTDSVDFNANCPARQFGNSGVRKRDEILNKPGVLVAWRSDRNTVWQFKYLKVTELA